MNTFVGNTDVDEYILLNLKLSELKEICKSNLYFYNICKYNLFWKKKILFDYPDIDISSGIPNYLEDYKCLVLLENRNICYKRIFKCKI